MGIYGIITALLCQIMTFNVVQTGNVFEADSRYHRLTVTILLKKLRRLHLKQSAFYNAACDLAENRGQTDNKKKTSETTDETEKTLT